MFELSLFRYTLPHRRKVSAIGERVFWSTLNKVEKHSLLLLIISAYQFLAKHLVTFPSFAGVAKLLVLLQYWKEGCDHSFVIFFQILIFVCTNDSYYCLLRNLLSIALFIPTSKLCE